MSGEKNWWQTRQMSRRHIFHNSSKVRKADLWCEG
ncbi:hypothetical protein PHET_08137 [Paragonimus heterotremus]|uniref:Uncharacterized protein n=1 Tax=Paragonimus heterotremus TaxID=100268 RepID=A0A8J4T6F5_9TREM|nr:hypothetical protein PHET_08137 [Paragonimus heterotremus]